MLCFISDINGCVSINTLYVIHLLIVQYTQHASADTLTPSLPSDASLGACSDDSVDIDMEKLKAEAKEVACIYLFMHLFTFTLANCVIMLIDLSDVMNRLSWLPVLAHAVLGNVNIKRSVPS